MPQDMNVTMRCVLAFNMGVQEAIRAATDPIVSLTDGRGIIFAIEATESLVGPALEAYKFGVQQVFPDCQFLVSSAPSGAMPSQVGPGGPLLLNLAALQGEDD